MLKGSLVAAGGAFLGFNEAFGFSRVLGQEMMADDDLQTIINLASTAELFATTHYLAAINAADALGLDEIQVAYLKAGFLAEQDHYDLLVSLGAKPVVTEFYVRKHSLATSRSSQIPQNWPKPSLQALTWLLSVSSRSPQKPPPSL